MNEEKAIEHLAKMRHAIKRTMGEYIEHVEKEEGNLDDINDSTVLSATVSVMCEFMLACGAELDDDFVERIRATYKAVQLADALRKAMDAPILGEIPMPTTTVQ